MAIAIEIVGGFNYETLKPEHAIFVQQQLNEIQGFLRQNVYHAIEVGQRLINIKSCMEHGVYLRWVESEFPWGKSAAYEFEYVAQRFKETNFQILEKFDISALKILATPSTPEDVREKALALAESGERISHARAKALKAGADVPVLEPGKTVAVTDERSPYYGQSVKVESVERKDGIVRCQTESGEDASLLLSELIPEPPQPERSPQPKSPTNNHMEAIAVGLEVEKERVQILEEMLGRVCVAARAGRLTDALLSEAESLLA